MARTYGTRKAISICKHELDIKKMSGYRKQNLVFAVVASVPEVTQGTEDGSGIAMGQRL